MMKHLCALLMLIAVPGCRSPFVDAFAGIQDWEPVPLPHDITPEAELGSGRMSASCGPVVVSADRIDIRPGGGLMASGAVHWNSKLFAVAEADSVEVVPLADGRFKVIASGARLASSNARLTVRSPKTEEWYYPSDNVNCKESP